MSDTRSWMSIWGIFKLFSVGFELLALGFRIYLCYCESLLNFWCPRPRRSVRGEVALITGAAHGLGREIAKQLAQLGVIIVAWDIKQEGNEATVCDIRRNGGVAHAYTCDITEPSMVKKVAAQVRDEVGEVTLLINNAGVLNGGKLLKLTDEQIRRCHNVNTLSHFWTVREFLPHMMKQNRGHIVTIVSMAGRSGTANLTDYCASKFSAAGFTEALQDELYHQGKHRIITTAVFPLFVETGMTKYPRFRFGRHMGAEETAAAIIDGVLREKSTLYIPASMEWFHKFTQLLPHKAVRLCRNFQDIGIDPQLGENRKVKRH